MTKTLVLTFLFITTTLFAERVTGEESVSVTAELNGPGKKDKERKAKQKARKKAIKDRQKQRKKEKKLAEKNRKLKQKGKAPVNPVKPKKETKAAEKVEPEVIEAPEETSGEGETTVNKPVTQSELKEARILPRTFQIKSSALLLGPNFGVDQEGEQQNGFAFEILRYDFNVLPKSTRSKGQGLLWPIQVALHDNNRYNDGAEMQSQRKIATGLSYMISPFDNQNKKLYAGFNLQLSSVYDRSYLFPRNEIRPGVTLSFVDFAPLFDNPTYFEANYNRGFGVIGHSSAIELEGRYCFKNIPELSLSARCQLLNYEFGDMKVSRINDFEAKVSWTIRTYRVDHPVELGIGPWLQNALLPGDVKRKVVGFSISGSFNISWNQAEDEDYNGF